MIVVNLIKMIIFFKKREGQALIESIAAIGIIVVGVLGALSFLSSSVSLNRVVTNQYTATYLAAALIEDVKYCMNISDAWSEVSYNNCLTLARENVNNILMGGDFELNGTNFNVYNVETCAGGESPDRRRDVCATVGWSERGRDFKVDLEDRFYNFR